MNSLHILHQCCFGEWYDLINFFYVVKSLCDMNTKWKTENSQKRLKKNVVDLVQVHPKLFT